VRKPWNGKKKEKKAEGMRSVWEGNKEGVKITRGEKGQGMRERRRGRARQKSTLIWA